MNVQQTRINQLLARNYSIISRAGPVVRGCSALAVGAALTLTIAAVGCSKKQPAAAATTAAAPASAAAAPAAAAPAAAGADHGKIRSLGTITVGGYILALSQRGAIAAGQHGAVSAKVKQSPSGEDWKQIKLYLWVEDAQDKRLSPPEKAIVEDGGLHLHASVPSGAGVADHLVFRLRSADGDKRMVVKLSPSTVGASVSPGVNAGHHEAHGHDHGDHNHGNHNHGDDEQGDDEHHKP